MSILMTNVCHYAGPGSIPILLRDFGSVYCHDTSFVDTVAAQTFEAQNPGAKALSAQTPQSITNELTLKQVNLEVVIHNDVLPNTPLPVEEIPLTMFKESFAALTLFPVELTQQFLPAMKANHHGRFVFVTSARYRQPEPGFAVATTIRAVLCASLGARGSAEWHSGECRSAKLSL